MWHALLGLPMIWESPPFVEIDENARGLWNRFLVLSEIEDYRQRKEEFYRFKSAFQQYIISVPKGAERLGSLEDSIVGGIYHVGFDKVAAYYDWDTGFKIERE